MGVHLTVIWVLLLIETIFSGALGCVGGFIKAT